MRRLIQKIAPKSYRQRAKESDLMDLYLNEYVIRGWDQTNKMWRNIVWPILNTNELRDSPPGLPAGWNLTLKTGTEDGVAAFEVVQPDNHHQVMPLDEHGDPELTRPINHPAAVYSGAESESSASGLNVGGVQVALCMAGGSSDSGSEEKRLGNKPAGVEITT
ncbi:hypothetical protein C8R45DRAFT_1015408 [Mycena sanguinolenta]|nr:hypothetical protein C8R45DRAFT_1015408 [Mycena sanguinolenta]